MDSRLVVLMTQAARIPGRLARRPVAAGLAWLLLLVTGCEVRIGGAGSLGGAAGEAKREPVPVPVATVVLEPRTFVLATTSTTMLRAVRSVQVTAERPGTVSEVLVEEGRPVREGEVLVRLDSRRLELELERARLGWERARKAHDRQREMLKEKLTSEREYEQAYFDERVAANAHELAALDVAQTRILAPFASVVAERRVVVGQSVTAGTPVMDLVQMDVLEAPLHLPIHEAWRMTPGQKVQLSSDKYPVGEIEATVDRIAPVVDEKTGTCRVVLEVEHREGLRPGLYFEARVVERVLERALIVPRSAVVYRGVEPVVFRVDDGKPVAAPVTLGEQTETEFQIATGLAAGQEIIVEGAGGLRSDSVIKIMKPDAASP